MLVTKVCLQGLNTVSQMWSFPGTKLSFNTLIPPPAIPNGALGCLFIPSGWQEKRSQAPRQGPLQSALLSFAQRKELPGEGPDL